MQRDRCVHPFPSRALVPWTAPQGTGGARPGPRQGPRVHRAWLPAKPRTPRDRVPHGRGADRRGAPGHPGRSPRMSGRRWGPARTRGRQLSTDPRPQHPPAHPHPMPDRCRTFTGRAQNAGGGRSKPNSSSTKMPTPPARGPPSSGDHAMLPQRAGLRTGGLAGKCAAPGLAGKAAVLCGCARQRSRPSPCPPPLRPLHAGAACEPQQPLHPARRHGDAQGARWEAGA